jgi:membrane protease YdiL (CAAX protease family)
MAMRTPNSIGVVWLVGGLLLAYSPSFMNPMLRGFGVDWGLLEGPASVFVWNWLAVVLLSGFILLVERRGPASIGLRRPSVADLGYAVLFWAIATAIQISVSAAMPRGENEGMAILLDMPLFAIVALILTTAFTEEILFRGYPIERLREASGSIWLALAVSFALFLIPHIQFFGPLWLLTNGPGVVLLYILYAWRRNLWACMLMHLLGNSLLLIPALQQA